MESSDTIEAAFTKAFRVGPAYVDRWAHEFDHWNPTAKARIANEALRASMLKLLRLRDELQRARGEFGPVSSLYPSNYPTENQRGRLHAGTVAFFQGFYETLDKMAALVSQHHDVFGNLPHRKLTRFIEALRPFALFPDTTLPVLEEARRFRTHVDHASSLPTHRWITAEVFSQFDARIMLIGALQRDGCAPEGTQLIEDSETSLHGLPLSGSEEDPGPTAEWYVVAPDEEMTTWALGVQLNALIGRIAACRDNSSAVTCAWEPTPTGDDVTLAYPLYAPMDGVVKRSWKTEFTLHASTTFDSEE